MPIAVSKGSAAYIDITDNPELIADIRKRLEATHHRPRVEFRSDKSAIALVFTDGGEIEIDVTAFMADLQTVQADSGTFFVYAADPVAANPPPVDGLCPC